MDTPVRLTARETELLQLLARGCTYIQVSDRLGVSVHTVESHVKNIYRKLNVHSARTAVWRAMELRLLVESHVSQLANQEA
jgi:DNA-binding NarL/FixJ family response regulator